MADHDVERVKALLDIGADPNYSIIEVRVKYVGCKSNRQLWLPAYHADGTPVVPEEDAENWLPNTPLRLVGFRISDCLLESKRISEFGSIANLLLARGADPVSALQLMELRYGKYDPDFVVDSERDAAFHKVFENVYKAAQLKLGNSGAA